MTDALRVLVAAHGLAAVLAGLAELCRDEAEAEERNGMEAEVIGRWLLAKREMSQQAKRYRDMPRGLTA